MLENQINKLHRLSRLLHTVPASDRHILSSIFLQLVSFSLFASYLEQKKKSKDCLQLFFCHTPLQSSSGKVYGVLCLDSQESSSAYKIFRLLFLLLLSSLLCLFTQRASIQEKSFFFCHAEEHKNCFHQLISRLHLMLHCWLWLRETVRIPLLHTINTFDNAERWVSFIVQMFRTEQREQYCTAFFFLFEKIKSERKRKGGRINHKSDAVEHFVVVDLHCFLLARFDLKCVSHPLRAVKWTLETAQLHRRHSQSWAVFLMKIGVVHSPHIISLSTIRIVRRRKKNAKLLCSRAFRDRVQSRVSGCRRWKEKKIIESSESSFARGAKERMNMWARV